MRKSFEQQLPLGIVPIPEVILPAKSRDELPPVLKALQYIYTDTNINSNVFKLLEDSVFPKNNHTGRPSMSLWEILVMGIVRLCLDVDYDRLHIIVNFDKLVRSILGVENTYIEGKIYSLQSIKENKELIALFVGKLIMPLKGKLSKAVKEEESSKIFKTLRNAHSAVEANINQLENNGLNRCPDKGIESFKRYVGFGILSYNLHHLGKDLIEEEKIEKEKAAKRIRKRRLRAVA